MNYLGAYLKAFGTIFVILGTLYLFLNVVLFTNALADYFLLLAAISALAGPLSVILNNKKA